MRVDPDARPLVLIERPGLGDDVAFDTLLQVRALVAEGASVTAAAAACGVQASLAAWAALGVTPNPRGDAQRALRAAWAARGGAAT